MAKETLSDKIQNRKGYTAKPYNTEYTLDIEDVREFIKKLLSSMWLNKGMKRTIIRFAGDKLIS